MHDPVLFPNPDEFRPERFIETTNPRLVDFELPFGFGRRICPGMHLARNSIFINIARLMWAFDVRPALDSEGKPIIPDSMNYTNGFNSKPVSFDCRIVPRNERVYLARLRNLFSPTVPIWSPLYYGSRREPSSCL